jgi:hypothetical protein
MILLYEFLDHYPFHCHYQDHDHVQIFIQLIKTKWVDITVHLN